MSDTLVVDALEQLKPLLNDKKVLEIVVREKNKRIKAFQKVALNDLPQTEAKELAEKAVQALNKNNLLNQKNLKMIQQVAKIQQLGLVLREYCEKWLLMQSAVIRDTTQEAYRRTMQKYIVDKMGDMYLDEVTPDDLKLLMVPVSKMSSAVYANVNMLVKCVFYSAERSRLVDHNPAAQICPRGGKPAQPREALSDEQKKILLDTIRGLPPYLFVMIGLYSGLRKEEILGLQWDCVFLDAKAPYISVRRAWHKDHNQTVVDTNLKTKAAKRDVPIPKCLVRCLQEEKNVSSSQYVIQRFSAAG